VEKRKEGLVVDVNEYFVYILYTQPVSVVVTKCLVVASKFPAVTKCLVVTTQPNVTLPKPKKVGTDSISTKHLVAPTKQ